MITLYNVTDIRTGIFHSIAIVSERNAKWYKEITDNGITKDCYIIYKETHTLDTKEMARLIDGVVQECQNVGIETKTPDQIAEMMNLWENYEKQKK